VDGYSFLPAWVVAFGVIAVFALILRWAFSRGGSLVPPPVRPGNPGDYGLLVPVHVPASAAEGEEIRRRLEQSGVRATVVSTNSGVRVMVFAPDADRARLLLNEGRWST
jgi:hypothetical protein